MIIRSLLCENGDTKKTDSCSQQRKATFFEGPCESVISCHLNVTTTNRKEWLSLPEYFALTLLCSISSSNQGSLLLIYRMTPHPVRKKCITEEEKFAVVADHHMYCPAGPGPACLNPYPPVFHVDFRSAWLSRTCLVIPGIWPDPDPDPALRIDLCAEPRTCFVITHLPEDLGSGLPSHPWLGVVEQATVSPSVPGFPTLWRSWYSCHQERTPLVKDTKIISKNNFVFYLLQLISRAYLWNLSIQQKTQEPKDVQSFPSGSLPVCPSPSLK